MTKKKRLISSYDNYDDFASIDRSMKAMKDLDPDLLEIFSDMGLSPKNKKSKKLFKKSNFAIGDQVNVKGLYGTIIYGPYKSALNKDTYEIETEDNQIITAEDDGKSITIYVPPIEEDKDDDLF